MKIGLLSDNHSYIDEAMCSYLTDCDEIWHAGDIGSLNVTERLQKVAPVYGVYGNVDSSEIRSEFPENQIMQREGLTVFMTHIGGKPGSYPKRVKAILNEQKPDLFICGHSHILKVAKDRQFQLLHMNPGACGKHGFHKMRTMIRFDIHNGKISNLEVIELGKRGQLSNER